jgi:hypothetical protein
MINNILSSGGVALRQREVAVTSDPMPVKTYSAGSRPPARVVPIVREDFNK